MIKLSDNMRKLIKMEYYIFGTSFSYIDSDVILIRKKYWEDLDNNIVNEWRMLVENNIIEVDYKMGTVKFPDKLIKEIFKE